MENRVRGTRVRGVRFIEATSSGSVITKTVCFKRARNSFLEESATVVVCLFVCFVLFVCLFSFCFKFVKVFFGKSFAQEF